MRPKARASALAVVFGSMILVGILAGASTAAAQEYGESRGRLGVGHRLEVSGSGFSANSAVRVELVNEGTGETTALGTVTSDGAGTLAGSVALPDGLAPGAYTLTAAGVTADGLTRVLSADLTAPGLRAEQRPGTTPAGMPAMLITSLLTAALLLAVGAWWWSAVAGKRRRGRRATPRVAVQGRTAEHPGWQPSGAPLSGATLAMRAREGDHDWLTRE